MAHLDAAGSGRARPILGVLRCDRRQVVALCSRLRGSELVGIRSQRSPSRPDLVWPNQPIAPGRNVPDVPTTGAFPTATHFCDLPVERSRTVRMFPSGETVAVQAGSELPHMSQCFRLACFAAYPPQRDQSTSVRVVPSRMTDNRLVSYQLATSDRARRSGQTGRYSSWTCCGAVTA
jgi:hypothetical protein